MTTSWAYFSRGEFALSASTNLAGFLLACLAVATAMVAALPLITRKPLSWNAAKACMVAAVAIFGISIIQWLWRYIL